MSMIEMTMIEITMIEMSSGLLDEIEVTSNLAPSVVLLHSKREQTHLLSSLFILPLHLSSRPDSLASFLVINQTHNLTMDEDDFINDEAEVSSDEASSDESDDGEEEESNCEDDDEASDPMKEQQLLRRLQQ